MNSSKIYVSLILLTLLIGLVFQSAVVLCEDPYERFLEMYGRVVNLALKGINVSQYVIALNNALQLLEENRSEEAIELMNRIEANLSELEPRADSIVFSQTVSKYATAAAILSLPVLVYLLLPRLYIYVWFKSRRRWVLVNERGKR